MSRHSLGGHNTLVVAAFDERVKAMVTSCGFTSMRKYDNGNLAGWEQTLHAADRRITAMIRR